jgi:hypothetical protein
LACKVDEAYSFVVEASSSRRLVFKESKVVGRLKDLNLD